MSNAKDAYEGVVGEVQEAVGKVLNNDELAAEGHQKRVAADARLEDNKEDRDARKNARTEGGDTLPLPDFAEKTTLDLDEATFTQGEHGRR